MCNRAAACYTVGDFIQLKLADFGGGIELPRLNLAPNSTLPVITHDGQGGLHLVGAAWGDPAASHSTFNARDDRLESAKTWSGLAGRADCHAIIVVSHAFEPFTQDTLAAMGEETATALLGTNAVQAARAGDTVWHGLHRRDGHPILIPALLGHRNGRPWATMVTTAGGPVFSRIHRAKASGDAREIVSLRDAAEVTAWMHPEEHDWRALLRPSTEDHMDVYRCPPGCMKMDAPLDLRFQAWTPPVEAQRRLF